jgi:hypothetical protein
MRNVPVFLLFLLFLLAVAGEAMAQSSNATYMVMQETMTSGGGEIGGGNPMQAKTALGLPAGGMAANSAFTLVGGLGWDRPAYVPPSSTQATITVTGTIDDSTATVIVSSPVNQVTATVSDTTFSAAGVALVVGSNTLTATATDAVGNARSTSVTVTYQPANQLPPPRPTVGTVGAPPPAVTTASSVTVGGTKVAGASIWLNGTQVVTADDNTTWTTTVSLVEGDNELSFIAKDSTGTSSAAATINVILDNLPPVVTFAPPAKTNFNPVTLTGSVDDSDTVVTINGVTATRTKRAFEVSVPLTLGSNTLQLIATSPNGHITTKTYTVILGTIPTIQTSQPADGAKAYAGTAVTLQVSAQDQEGDPIQCQFLINGAPLADWSSAMSQTWTPSTNQLGVHTITVKVRDDYGGSNSKDVEVLVVRPPINHP